MNAADMFCADCGANQNAGIKQQYFTQAAPVLNTPKKKSYGGIITVLVMILFIGSIVGAILIFGIGGVKAGEMSGTWSIGLSITSMSDDKDYYDYSDYIGETTEGNLIVDLDEDGNGTARLVTTIEGTDYDYEVMDAQYSRGKLICIADTASESIEFTGNVRKKGDRYQLSGKFKMTFIEDEKTTATGKWTATKEIKQTADNAPGNSSKPDKNDTEDLPNLAVYATMLDIIGEWEGTAVLASFTGYEENRAFFMDSGAPDDFIEQFDNMKGKDSPIFLEIDDDYGWEVTVDVDPMGEMSISDLDFGYDENDVEIDGKMKLEKGRFQLANSERDGDIGSAAFNFKGSVLTNDDGSYALKGSLTLSMEFDAGTVPLEMVFTYDMLRSMNTEE